MTRIEKLACIWMGRRLQSVRHRKKLTATEMARRLGMRTDGYRARELGRVQITIDFLLRAQAVLQVGITQLWFPFWGMGNAPKEPAIEAALSDLLDGINVVTVEHVVEAAADVFQIPVWTITTGLGAKKVRQARTAAAFVVGSIHNLKLSDLARLVCRTRRALEQGRQQAQKKASKDFWRKVAAIRGEVESL